MLKKIRFYFEIPTSCLPHSFRPGAHVSSSKSKHVRLYQKCDERVESKGNNTLKFKQELPEKYTADSSVKLKVQVDSGTESENA